jgi:hypothetical protein
MSFSKLPPELKIRIAVFAKDNDAKFRESLPVEFYVRHKKSDDWDSWFGKAALALAGTSKVMRTLALPYAVHVSSSLFSFFQRTR